MTSQPMSPLPVGQVLEIGFATFTPRITIHSAGELTVEVIAGDDIEFLFVRPPGRLCTTRGWWPWRFKRRRTADYVPGGTPLRARSMTWLRLSAVPQAQARWACSPPRAAYAKPRLSRR
jgi:hypothetical protein